AEITAKLAVDRRRRISRERNAARRVEAAGRRDEPDRRDLEKIVERLAPARVATGERTHERQMPFDEIQTRIHPPHSRSIFLLSRTKRKRIANGCIDLLSCGYFPHARVAIRGARNRTRRPSHGSRRPRSCRARARPRGPRACRR